MTTSTSIIDIRATFDLLTAQLAQYALEESDRISNFAKLVSSKGVDTATEAVMNDLAGKLLAKPGAGVDMFTRVVARREEELNEIKNAKDSVMKIKEKLRNVGGRLVSGN